ncbi:unnamed protein product [Ilex paraguariensis]|uniref:Uncharacterized protein n=1 Tax=Ilex paraguariensis TaxID=185542 RepID=A0ABC8SFS0_9AQUA
MGCTNSKLDDLPAVALCRDRCDFLDEAIHQRYTLAEAHVAYMHSLKGVGLSLHRFFDHDLDGFTPGPPSPVLKLPTQRKGHTEPFGSPAKAAIRHSHSNSGSHLHFHSGSEDEDPGSESLHHHHSENNALPVQQHRHISYADSDTDTLGLFPEYNGLMSLNINYMKNQTTPSVVYEQRPISPEIVRMGESSSYDLYSYNNANPSTYSYNNANSSTYSYYNFPTNGGFFGSSAPLPYSYSSPPPPVGASSASSSSKPPPPPPSPPQSSAWDFLYAFEGFEKYYPPYTPSRDSEVVREEEGIPALEAEDFRQEVAKDVHGERKIMEGGGSSSGGDGGGSGNYAKTTVDDKDGKTNDSKSLYHTRPSVSMENDPVEYEVHVVDKKLVDNEERSGDGGSVAGLKGDFEVVREIQVQFERASESGNELTKMLEVGKLPHNRKHAAYQASKILHVNTPSLLEVSSRPSTSKSTEPSFIDPAYLDTDENPGLRSKNLSSSLQKLYLWEKKLYDEVKAEERMRVLHERKSRKLKFLGERGAEAQKVDATRTLVRSLSTKIRIAIQVVDKISVKINKSRDEELWPQLNEFVQGLVRMWKSMHECHRNQCHAIGEARRLDAITSHKGLTDTHLEATLQLEHELLNWALRFSCWVGAQKGYVRALNNWLLKCLLYVPEETPDGMAPFSPGRIGAPPVFVICNQWSQTLERISEKEVVDSMRDFASNVLQLWERDKLEMRQRMMVNKDLERKVKNLEREDQKIQEKIQVLDKRMVLVSGDGNGLPVTGHIVYQSETRKNSSLHVNLLNIFEAMERFTASNLKVYEGLLQRIEEDKLDQDIEKVS